MLRLGQRRRQGSVMARESGPFTTFRAGIGKVAGDLTRPRRDTKRTQRPAVARTGIGVPALLRRRAPPPPPRVPGRLSRILRLGYPDDAPAVTAARRLNRASGILSTAVLADSAVEHYRGSFENPAMFLPLISAALSLVASGHGVSDRRGAPHAARNAIYAAAGMIGVAGTGFHLYNIGKRPGGYSWLNFFYAAPVGAPFALTLAGALGYAAERVRENPPRQTPKIFGLPAGRLLAGISSLGLLGTVGEVGLLHFRGAYHDPAMFLPVSIPPVAAGLLGDTALRSPPARHGGLSKWWLRLTAVLGLAGIGFHIFGVSRDMGGWGNWKQNVLNGPPLPAPPSFTGLALAGLAALRLLEDHPDA